MLIKINDLTLMNSACVGYNLHMAASVISPSASQFRVIGETASWLTTIAPSDPLDWMNQRPSAEWAIPTHAFCLLNCGTMNLARAPV